MKRLSIVMAALLLATTAPVSAQETPAQQNEKGATVQTQGHAQPQPARGDILAPANLAARLNLADEQRARIEGLWRQYNERTERIRRDTSLTSEQRILRLRQAREEYIRLIRSVLNEEQLKQFEALLEEQTTLPADLSNIQLTPEQIEKLTEIAKRYNKLREEVQKDTSLTPDQRARRLKELEDQMLMEVYRVLPKQLQELMDRALKQQQQSKQDKKEGSGEKKDSNPPQQNNP
ncbi:MAG: hypothetical protein RMJ83_00355 [Armatimonadota bacterium]|nr:hypothetical protein [Armatimonadota bacterium]